VFASETSPADDADRDFLGHAMTRRDPWQRFPCQQLPRASYASEEPGDKFSKGMIVCARPKSEGSTIVRGWKLGQTAKLLRESGHLKSNQIKLGRKAHVSLPPETEGLLPLDCG
jgi:hypothetical protein